MAVTSVTQTWRVGPRSGSGSRRSSGDDSEQTISIVSPRLVFKYYDKSGSIPVCEIELRAGLHSFWLDEKGELGHQSGKHDDAIFEVEINQSGSFFIATSGSSVTLNGRLATWSRLRFQDRIEYGDQSLVVDSPHVESPDLTIVRRRSKNTQSFVKTRRRGIARVWRVVIASLCIAVVLTAALAGYFMAEQGQGQEVPVLVTVPKLEIVGASIPVPIEVPQEAVEDEKPKEVTKAKAIRPEPFGQKEFELQLSRFRAGKKKMACDELRKAATTPRGVWKKKASLFVERRCGS
jgi:hypothetical protein